MNQNRQSAFTLLELIATVAVVGILAGIAFTLYKSYDERATSVELIELYDVLREETIIDADTGGIDLCADPSISLVSDTPSSPYGDLSIVKTDLGYGKPIGLHFKADVATEGEHNTGIVRETYNTLNKNGFVAPGAINNDSVVSFTALLVNTPCSTTNAATTSPPSAPVSKSQADCQPHQHFSAAQKQCNDVCQPGRYFDPVALKCSSTPPPAAPVAKTDPPPPPPPPPPPTKAATGAATTADKMPTKDDHPCKDGDVFIPDDPTLTTFPITGTCQPDSVNRKDPYKPVKCQVCSGRPQICERLHHEETCEWPNNICINELVNHDTGARELVRRCGHRQDAVSGWVQGASKNDKCTNFDPKFVQIVDFTCTYACTGDNCNEDPNMTKDGNAAMYNPRP